MEAALPVPAGASRGSSHNELSVEDHKAHKAESAAADPITYLSKSPILSEETSCLHFSQVFENLDYFM